MFDDSFSFDTQRSSSMDTTNSSPSCSYSRSVSPFTPTKSVPSASFTVGDLTAQFAGQRIRRDAQICYDSCASYANSDDDAGWSIEGMIEPLEIDVAEAPVSRSATFPQRLSQAHSSSQRLQRQTNARLLYSSSHAGDIAVLVSRMVESSEQCSVHCPSEAVVSADDDEGYDSTDGSTQSNESRTASIARSKRQLLYRRSSELNSTGACVSKATRFRKPGGHSRVRSGEKP